MSFDSDLDERVLETRAAVLRAAVPAGIRVSFGEGRRRSDLTLALLRGERLSVLTLAPRLLEDLPADIEIVRSAEVGGNYELMMALTDRLEQQPLRSPERRAKLRQMAEEPVPDAETASLLEGGEAAWLGGFRAFWDQLLAIRSELRGEHEPAQWQAVFNRLLDALFRPVDDAEGLALQDVRNATIIHPQDGEQPQVFTRFPDSVIAVRESRLRQYLR